MIKELDSGGKTTTKDVGAAAARARAGRADAAGRQGDLLSLFHDDSADGAGRELQEDARQRLKHLQADRDVAFAESNAQLRADELQNLERDLNDISDIVRDVGVMVQAQGDQLGEGSRGVAANLTHARASAHKAAVETAKAGKARAKRRTVEGALPTCPTRAAGLPQSTA